MGYKKKLCNPKWQKKRLEILERDEWKCRLCDDTETELHVHHLEYHGDPWKTPSKHLVTLCAHCHVEAERVKNDSDFKELKMYKSVGWSDKSRIMFLRQSKDIVGMAIYAEDESPIIGYNFSVIQLEEIKAIFE